MCTNPKKETFDSYCIVFGEDDIKREILKNGPVVAVTNVHTDFLTYKSGVYYKGEEVPKFSGFTTIKIIGWGFEDGKEGEIYKGNKYWIIENFWGEDWGENGYARISMYQDLMFDQYAYSIKMKIPEVLKSDLDKKNENASGSANASNKDKAKDKSPSSSNSEGDTLDLDSA
jgi:cathepsin B